MTPRAQALASRVFAFLKPPEKIVLSQWTEDNLQLPDGHKARPGPYRNWPYMREILDCIGDDVHTYVDVLKPSRVGYTKGLMMGIAAKAKTNPGPMCLLLPTDEDATEIVGDELDPIFEVNDSLKGLLKVGTGGRVKQLMKYFKGGGHIRIRSAHAPRKLRRIDVRDLFIDEADGMEITKEGDAVYLAEQRTRAHPDRKIVCGSTPTEEGVSITEERYNLSDMRIYLVPCPLCSAHHELMWEDINWDKDENGVHKFETAHWVCPSCKGRVHERHKAQMVENGYWHKQAPWVKDRAGFRFSALISTMVNASWRQLAKEYIDAKRAGPKLLMVFHNTILGRPWRFTKVRVDADSLRSRAEPFGAPSRTRKDWLIPKDVLMILAGADVQDDRIEVVLMGFTMTDQPHVLAHFVFEGNTLESDVWRRLDEWHRGFTVKHPNGWHMRIDGMAIDSGGREGRTQIVYEWCGKRLNRAIYAIKGDDGPNRAMWADAKKIKGDVRLKIVGTDQCKTAIMDAYGRIPIDDRGVVDGRAMRFSDSLPPEFYDQVTNETRRIRYVQNRAVIEFKPKKEGLATEALDCCVYAWAMLSAPAIRLINLADRRDRIVTPDASAERKPETVGKRMSKWAEMMNKGQGRA